MKKVILIGSIVIAVGLGIYYLMKDNEQNYYRGTNLNPEKDGYVSDANTAIRVAKAIWLPIYGKEVLEKEEPFNAVLKNDSIWVVQGTIEEGADGGTVYAEIQKKDCKVLQVTHYK